MGGQFARGMSLLASSLFERVDDVEKQGVDKGNR